MKIIFLRSNPVNPDSRVEKEVNSLIKAGNIVNVFSWDRSTDYATKTETLHLEDSKTNIFRVGIKSEFGLGFKKNVKPLISFQIKMYKWLMENHEKFDVIHACDFDTALTAYIVAKRLGKRMVYDIFDYYIDSFSVPGLLKPVIEGIDKHIIDNAEAVIICTEERKEQISNTKPKYLEVIHNTPMNINIVKDDMNINIVKDEQNSTSKVKVCYVGILQDNRFLKEITEVIKKYDEIEFHVGGFGQHEDYFKKMSKENSNIIFYGKLPYKETLILEQQCDIMVAVYNPSVKNHKYSAPNKLYEALMLGKPIIMAKETGLDSIVKENDIGVVIHYTPTEFEEALHNLIKRKNEWNQMSQRGKKLYDYYSWKNMERKLIKLYKYVENASGGVYE